MPQAQSFAINLSVQNSPQNAAFFLALGFTESYEPLLEDSRLFAEENLQVQLSTTEGIRTGIVLVTEQPLDKLATALQQTGIQTAIQDTKIQLIAPDGTALYWIHRKQSSAAKVQAMEQSLCGSFYEISLEVEDMNACRHFWELAGFKKILPAGDLSTWLTMSNQLLKIGLYQKGSCPHPFRSPALTWFNTDAGQRLANLQQQGFHFAYMLPATAEGKPEEAILESPEGHHLFLFKAW